ncbi:Uncharacterised protein [Proteus mirabilis]|uniref:Uncharacterized protein n=1 Tax=Proteus mirabilis TaxID=584 RepID=A0A2X2C367_PROMI|nr:Uncharacterised protein [Proteus mirabilis]
MHPLEAALLELEEAKKRLANIDKQYQAQVAVINKLKATPEGLALADPVKNPLVYKMDGKEYKDVKFDDPELLKAILNKEENFASIVSLKYKNQFKGAKLFEVVVILSFLGDSILKNSYSN